MSKPGNAIVMNTHALPYRKDSSYYFEAIRSLSWPIWLDSGKPGQSLGRYDIISAQPVKKMIADSQGVRCIEADSTRSYTSPWEMLRCETQALELRKHSVELPFTQGAMGYLGYDLGRELEQLPNSIEDDLDAPLMLMGLYDWAIIQDHQQKLSWLVCHQPMPAEKLQQLLKRLTSHRDGLKSEASFSAGPFTSNTTKDGYLQKVDEIKAYIAAGDCYQVNFAQRYEATYKGDPFIAYQALRKTLPSPYSAYFETEYGAILSLSPEQFLQSDGNQVVTQPIKGTSARGANTEQDILLAEKLKQSPKDRAENLMIVDLLRNDLSKVCSPVKTAKLFELQSYANVHHLVSTVTGDLKPEVSAIDLLQACFPGGSITGAPKIRAMEIIEEKENSRRSVYCGSIGYIDISGRMDTNIAIRTILANQDKLFVWGGGGIVSDSSAESEYDESLAKIGLILETLISLPKN